ncbi:hypothetical protein B0H10DRAFT_1781888, partial [Mycena sp. CBHHK59/15]
LLLFYAQVLAIFPAKWVMVTAIIIFELGSLLCGVSQNVDQLIAGRTVSGAGIVVSSIQIISQVTRLEDRPVLFALAGAAFGVSSVVGPLVGGALTDHVRAIDFREGIQRLTSTTQVTYMEVVLLRWSPSSNRHFTDRNFFVVDQPPCR